VSEQKSFKIHPQPRRRSKKQHLNRRWIVDYKDMIYDGGYSASWSRGYRTKIGARLAMAWQYYMATWGGEMTLHDNRRK